jgi:hypothetical protein
MNKQVLLPARQYSDDVRNFVRLNANGTAFTFTLHLLGNLSVITVCFVCGVKCTAVTYFVFGVNVFGRDLR